MKAQANAVIAMLTVSPAMAQDAVPRGFVSLRAVDPSIAQDIRYAGANNLVGRALPGYEDAACILRIEVEFGGEQRSADEPEAA